MKKKACTKIPDSYARNSELPAPLGVEEQTLAFASFEESKYALRCHLHRSAEVARHILELARACASGAAGSKNDAKKYFELGMLSVQSVHACEAAVDAASFSEALHGLGGKPALYEECLVLAREAVSLEGLGGEATVCTPGVCATTLERLAKEYVWKRNHLVQSNLRLAASEVNRHPHRGMSTEDLMQHAAIGLQKAVECFKAALGNRFSTFAIKVIKSELIRACENSSQQIRLPSHVWSKVRKYNEVSSRLSGMLGHTPSMALVAAELEITEQEAVQLRQIQYEPVSLSAPQGEGEDARTFEEVLVDEAAPIPGQDSSVYTDFIAPYSGGLTFMEQTVLRKYVGDYGCPQMEKEDIAFALGMSLEEVSRTLVNGLEKVRFARELERKAA